MKKNIIGLILGPILFLVLYFMPSPEGMNAASQSVLAIIAWVGTWWVSEAVPIPISSLLPLILFPLLGVLPIGQITPSYANKLIFLFIGGFILALGMERWNLHKRIALNILVRLGSNTRRLILGFIIASGFLSMWISNTATTMMMVPIALAIISQFRSFFGPENEKQHRYFAHAILLGIAYSASIGGMATIIGTPTNLIFVDAVEQNYAMEFSFAKWMPYGFPISIFLLAVCWWHLTYNVFKLPKAQIGQDQHGIQAQLTKLGHMSWEEKWVAGVFGLVALAWILRSLLAEFIGPGLNDTTIALVGATLLFIIPAKNQSGPIMDWATAVKLPWGILLLFGGAFAIALGVSESGLGDWLAGRLALLKGISPFLVLLVLIGGVNFFTEITQNMGTCSLMMPVLVSLAPAIDTHPFGLMAANCVAASCAFMLPFATAPNVIVFGTGLIEMKEMIRAGIWLNLISILIITVYTYFALPLLWQVSWDEFPQIF